MLREHRDHGLGRSLMQAAETAAWRRGHARLAIHAQLAVIPFYERLGWRAVGPEFVEASIAHRKMEKTEPVAPAGEGWRRLRADWQRTLVDELAALPGVEAVVLGGSHARGHAHPARTSTSASCTATRDRSTSAPCVRWPRAGTTLPIRSCPSCTSGDLG